MGFSRALDGAEVTEEGIVRRVAVPLDPFSADAGRRRGNDVRPVVFGSAVAAAPKGKVTRALA